MMKISELQKVAIALFLGFAFAIVWTIIAHVRYHDKIPFEFYCLYPLSLGLAAVMTAMMFEGNLLSLHLKFPKVKYSIYGILYSILLLFLPFALNLITNTITINGSPDDNGLIIFGIPIFIILAMGEEVMWRGLVFSKLKEKIGYRKSSLVIGVITAVWNFPLIIVTRFLYPDKTLTYVIPMFILYSVFLSFIYTYLRTLSKSVWPSIAMHGMSTYFLFSMVMPVEMPVEKGNDHYTGDIGIFYVIAAFLTALVLTVQLLKKIRHKEKRRKQFRAVKSDSSTESLDID